MHASSLQQLNASARLCSVLYRLIVTQTHSHIWYWCCSFLLLSFYYSCLTVSFESQWTTYQCCHFVYLSPIWFRSFLFKYTVRLLAYHFFVSLLSSAPSFQCVHWNFYDFTKQPHKCKRMTMRIATICDYRLALQMGIICKPAFMRAGICQCALTKQSEMFELQLRRKREICKTWFHANAEIRWTTNAKKGVLHRKLYN